MASFGGGRGVDLDQYWNEFYRGEHVDIEEPSSFARYSAALIQPGSVIFEIGCGNGRDALYFAGMGMQVIASDASAAAIDRATSHARRLGLTPQPRFLHRHMEALDDDYAGTLDVVYMRFVLHAVPHAVASDALRWAARNLVPGGRLFVEARSVLGSLYGKGEAAGRDAFFQDGHYRRFLRLAELEHELADLGFAIDESCERNGLAIHADDDPVVIRVVARIS
jgi:SAM-dependent methyltransferase